MCENNPPPCFAQHDEGRIPKKSKINYFFHGSCLTKELWATRPHPLVNFKIINFLFLFGKLKLEIVAVGDLRSEVVVKINQERMEGD